jgi:hypothetical protein
MAALAAPAASARAQPARPPVEPVRLSWVRGRGADGCSSQPQIAAQVTARLGRSPFAADAARSVDAYVTRDERGFRAEIYARGRDGALEGSRELISDAPDCASIEAAGVLALALAIDPDAGARPPPAPAPPLAPPRAPPPDPGLALPAPLPAWVAWAPPEAPPEPAPAAFGPSGVAVHTGLGLGLLPGVAPAISLAARLAVARSVQVSGEALWMPEARASDARFAFGLSAFALGACGSLLRRERVDLAACGALWGGAVHAVVYGLTPTGPGDRAWAAAEVSARLRIRVIGRLHVEVSTPVLVPLVRQPFTVTGLADPVFQQAPVALLPTVGVGASFP